MHAGRQVCLGGIGLTSARVGQNGRHSVNHSEDSLHRPRGLSQVGERHLGIGQANGSKCN